MNLKPLKSTALYACICLLTAQLAFAQSVAWQPITGQIMTRWAKDVSPENVWPEYPRPQMVRTNWQNLNGSWDYAIRPKNEQTPQRFDGTILVPFAVESALSGVKKTVGEENRLWYRRSFEVPAKWAGQRVLLHFGAVDWETHVYINGKPAGKHQGGYDPFSFDITDQLKKSGKQEIVVSVWDPTDAGTQPRGKQVKKPEAIWYTPVTGIWQTVWLEPVPTASIRTIKNVPDIDKQTLTVTVEGKGTQASDVVKITARDGNREIASVSQPIGQASVLQIPNPKLWAPSNPFLYDLTITLLRNGKPVDEVKSYFGMRKISLEKDKNGVSRIMLNNEFQFQLGTLDQGWWPDGLYTAPTDEALKFDIEKTKEYGFNMIRKHVKVEPARWYTHCDRIGMLVWQDMPSGDKNAPWKGPSGIDGEEITRSEDSEKQYRQELKAMIDAFYNFPSIVVWVPFNEGWGQFKTVEILNWTMKYDPTRLTNGASGGNHFPAGHILDHHQYPGPAMPAVQSDRAVVLGEFGGLGLPIEGHLWQEKKNWGYKSFESQEALEKAYKDLIEQIPALIEKGLSAAIYTQTTDVEIEVNGLMTYDRSVLKMRPEQIRPANVALYRVISPSCKAASSSSGE